MKYQAVLFDLDGTLLDTLQDIADAVNRALAQMGLPPHRLEAYRYFVGDGRETLAVRSLPERRRDQVSVRKLVELIDAEYSACWAQNTRPYPGMAALLDELAKQNVRMAILTNKEHHLAAEMVSAILPRWRFEAITGASPDIPKKPDPSSALKLARQLGVEPGGIAYLGDTDIDMKTAVRAGMYPVGALWGFRTRDELLAGGAKALVESPCDLLRLL
ncbi:MAG: HAD family hydrolase [Chloroflexi bacterium]|nr:HAD family hydrolase [Chloroflexota bacterium]